MVGSNGANTAAIRHAGDCGWINEGETTLSFHLGSTYNYAHYFNLIYLIA